MAKRDNPSDRFTRPTPENQAGQVNGKGLPLRVWFADSPDPDRAHVQRLGEGSD